MYDKSVLLASTIGKIGVIGIVYDIYYSIDEVCGSSESFSMDSQTHGQKASSLPRIEACICVHGCEIFVRAMN